MQKGSSTVNNQSHHQPRSATGTHVHDAGPTEAQQPAGPEGPFRNARRYTYSLLHSPEIDTRLEFYVRVGIATLIVLNVLAIVLESVREIDMQFAAVFEVLEVVSVCVFATEYILRVWSAVEMPQFARPIIGRLRYVFSFFALIDLLAILPFFLHAFGTFDLRFVRALRLMRLMRVLKLGRYSESLALLTKVVRSKREDILVSLFVIILMLVLSSSLMYFLENEQQPDKFPNIPASLWWGVATLTTVGYGDVYPITAAGKVCSAVIALLGIGLVALPSGLIVAGFVEELQARKEQRTCPHCGKPI